MAKECIIIGKTNVGKTQFLLNFADFLGMRKLEVSFKHPGGTMTKRVFTLQQARERLVSSQLHKTRCLQSLTLSLPAGKGSRDITMVDSAGVTDGIHEEADVRKAIAQALAVVTQADVILHMIDAAEVGRIGLDDGLSEFDHQLAHYGAMKGKYALLANKVDLPEGREGADLLNGDIFTSSIFPISAQNKKGFKEVKAFVLHNF